MFTRVASAWEARGGFESLEPLAFALAQKLQADPQTFLEALASPNSTLLLAIALAHPAPSSRRLRASAPPFALQAVLTDCARELQTVPGDTPEAKLQRYKARGTAGKAAATPSVSPALNRPSPPLATRVHTHSWANHAPVPPGARRCTTPASSTSSPSGPSSS